MNIAIVGGGFSGVASAWHLLNRGFQVTLFDPKGIGGSTSGIAAGLVHPFAGAHAKLNHEGLEGWQASCELFDVASQALGYAVADKSGIFRIAMDDEQRHDYALCAAKYPEYVIAHRQAIEGAACQEGIWIKPAAIVDSKAYLRGLWLACERKGGHFEKKAVYFSELAHFDYVVCTLGAHVHSWPELKDLPITQVKGQVLELQWPHTSLPCAINSYIYFIPRGENCLIGASYERDYHNEYPDMQKAWQEVGTKAAALVPSLTSSHIIACHAGIRASTPNHLPLLKQVNKRLWVLTGMGSKGLLYHALYAGRLAFQLR